MYQIPTTVNFNRDPVFLIEVPATAMDDFPAAALDVFRPRTARLVVGGWLGPLLGLLVAAMSAFRPRTALLANTPSQIEGNAQTWVFVVLIALVLIVILMNYMYGDWTMFAGATVMAPLVALGCGFAGSASSFAAAALALSTLAALQAHKARGIRYERLSPILVSRRCIDGAVVDVTYNVNDDKDENPYVTVDAGGRLTTARYVEGSGFRPAIGHQVAVWVCDPAPDIVVMCITRVASADLRYRPSRSI